MLVLTLLAATATMAPAAFAQSAKDIVGTWESENGGLRFEMFDAGSQFHARLLYGNQLVEADNVTFFKDTKNPDPTLRSRSLKHIILIRGLTWKGGEWVDGSFYDARSGTTYSCNAKIVDGKLHMRGYVGISLLGQTIVFRRLST